MSCLSNHTKEYFEAIEAAGAAAAASVSSSSVVLVTEGGSVSLSWPHLLSMMPLECAIPETATRYISPHAVSDDGYRALFKSVGGVLHTIALSLRDGHNDKTCISRIANDTYPLPIPDEVWARCCALEDSDNINASHASAVSVVNFCCLVSHLERFLAQLLVHIHHQKRSNGSRASTSLQQRDLRATNLLSHPSLVEFLGPQFMLLLQTFIGPLFGMNLRNLLYHGFLSPTDPQWIRHYTHVLALLIANVGSLPIVGSFDAASPSRTHNMSDVISSVRDPSCERRDDDLANVLSDGDRHPKKAFGWDRGSPERVTDMIQRLEASRCGGPSVDARAWCETMPWGSLSEEANDKVRNIVLSSVAAVLRGYDGAQCAVHFVPESFECLWKLCLELVVAECRWCEVSIGVGILVEVGLRRMYCQVNSEPHYFATPDEDAILPTLDDIIAVDKISYCENKIIPHSDSKANALLEWLHKELCDEQHVRGVPDTGGGRGALAFLLDNNVWKAGPNLRSNVAHACFDVTTIPSSLVLPQVALLCALEYAVCRDNGTSDETAKSTSSSMLPCADWVRSYDSIVSPLCFLRRDLSYTRTRLHTFTDWVKTQHSAVFPEAQSDSQKAYCDRLALSRCLQNLLTGQQSELLQSAPRASTPKTPHEVHESKMNLLRRVLHRVLALVDDDRVPTFVATTSKHRRRSTSYLFHEVCPLLEIVTLSVERLAHTGDACDTVVAQVRTNMLHLLEAMQLALTDGQWVRTAKTANMLVKSISLLQ